MILLFKFGLSEHVYAVWSKNWIDHVHQKNIVHYGKVIYINIKACIVEKDKNKMFT